MPKPARIPADLAQLLTPAGALDQARIDMLYGLEPVLQDLPHASLDSDLDVQCPYCWEHYQTRVDLTAGSRQDLHEDCAICCRPVTLSLVVGADGNVVQYTVRRLDGSDD